MRKIAKSLLVFILAVVMLAGNAISVYAKELQDMNIKFIGEYTENDVHVIVYEIIPNALEIMPRFPIHQEKSVLLTYEGWITPPSIYNYNVWDEELNTQMTGTLYLTQQDQRYINQRKITVALYKGTVSGNI